MKTFMQSNRALGAKKTFTQSNRALGAKKSFKLILAAMLMMIGLQAKAEKKVYTEFVESTGTLTYYYDDQMSSRSGIVEKYDPTSSIRFESYNTKVTKAVVDESMKDAPLTDMTLMFSSADSKNHLIALTSIEGLENLNTANVNYMDYMFYGCSSLESLDLSSFNTEAVKGMSNMFGECSSLSSLDISSFNTSNVKDMVSMFKGCSSLTSLDLSGFKNTNVTNMISLFEGCSALTSLNLSNFNTAKVTNMKDMFSGCSSLTSLDLSSFNTANVETMQYMFLHCSSLISLNLSSFNTANVTNMSNMFHDCASLKLLDLSSFNTANVKEMSGMFAGCSSLESLNLSSFNTAKVTKMTDLFRKCSSLTSLDLSLFNTANVTDMSSMFMNCSSLTALDLSSFDTGNVERMTGMFDNCSSLTSLNLTSFNTAKVKNMDSMFESCSSLTKLDLSNFSVNSLSNTRRMFIFCNHLTTIYCNSDWNQGNQIYGTYMFEDCKNLKGGKGTTYRWIFEDQIIYARPDGGKDAPGYFTLKKTGKLVYSEFDEKYSTLTYYYDDKMYDDIQRPGIKEEYDHAEDPYFKRFEGYNGKVQTVRIDPSMKDVELLSTANMFMDLSKAKAIVGIENLNTSKVKSMKSMFEGCSSLVNLDLCTFDVQQVTDMSNMFDGCFQLSTIYCDKDWSQSATIQQSTDMFHKCFVLNGSKDTRCDGEKWIDKSYARPDGGKERPGYFTLPTEEALIDGVNYLLNNKIHTATVLPLLEGKYEGNIIIPEVVKYCGTNYTVVGIGDKAFKDCDGLTSITVEAKNPLTLGEDAFEGVPADIPVYVPDESKWLYENTEGWKVFEDFHTTPHIIDGICYELDPNTYFAKVVSLPNGKYKGNIIVPQEVTYEGVKYKVNSVGKYAFARCPELISVSLPSTITDIADFAFLGSPALTTINIPDDNKTYCDIEGIVYSKNKKTLLFYPNGRYGGYEVPEGTLRIEHNVFNGTDLRWMILPESLKEIGSFALDQTNLVWLVSKSTSPAVAEELAFYSLNKQIPVYVPEESLEAYQTADEWKEFTNIISGIKRHVQVGDFYYDLYLWNKYADVVGAVNEPSGTLVLLSEIDVDVNTLYGISGSGDENDLVHFTVTGIGKEAFKLDQMNEVIIPGTITSIGMHAFYGCTKLVNVELSEGLEEIKAFAFAKCQQITSIKLPESLVTIGQDALAACGFTDVTIPDKVKTIGGYAFEDCKNLKWVEIGTSVRHIGNCAFKNANQLLGVFANGETAPLLGENVFLNCSNLKQVYVPCGALDHYRRVWKQYFQLILNDPISYYYTITATPSEHGTVEVPTSDCDHNLTAIPDEGYQFVKWTDGNTDNPRFVETPKENLVFEAVFEPKNYRWLVESSNDEWGYVSSPKTLEWYPYNTEMIAIAVPKDGYKFIKWNDGYMNTPYNFNLTKDTYLRAIFIPENEEPEIPQFTMQVTAAKIRWWKKDEAFLYSLDIYMDEECTQLFASYLFDKNGYIVAVSLAPKAPSRNWKEEQETEFQYNITGLTADTKYYYRMKTTDEEGKLIYTDEGDFRTLNSAVYVVIQHIDAIGEVTYTSECGTNIELAREAYDALSDENKALVANYNTLVEAENRYAELEAAAQAAALADAKDQLSDVIAQLQILQQIAQEYGMTEIAETIGAAITAATDVLNGDAVSISDVTTAMWNAIMALEDAKEALVLVAQEQFKQQLDQLLLPDDSEACILIIENAKAAVDELCLDPSMSMAENIAALMLAGQEIFEQAQQDLADQRAQDQPQGIITVEPQNTSIESRKILRNGMLIIERNGKMYNAQGIVIQ